MTNDLFIKILLDSPSDSLFNIEDIKYLIEHNTQMHFVENIDPFIFLFQEKYHIETLKLDIFSFQTWSTVTPICRS